MTGEGFPPFPPGMRRINPEAEAARLAEAHKSRTAAASWPVVIDEIRQIPGPDGGDGMIFVHLRVSASRFSPAPADLGDRLAAALAEHWPAADGT